MYVDGKSLDLNDVLSRRAMTGANTSAHDFSKDVGKVSPGDDLFGSWLISSSAASDSMSL